MRVGMDHSTVIEQYNRKENQSSVAQQEIVKDKVQSNDSGTSMQEKAIIDAIEKSNGKFDSDKREYEFVVHEKTREIMVRVIDPVNKEVLKEFPSEQILNMVAKMCELAGLFIDEKR